MRKTRLAAATTVAGLITLFSASTAFGYGDEPVVPSDPSNNVTVEPGEDFSVSGTFGGAEVSTYTATFNGEVVGSGENTTTWEANGTAPTEPGTYTGFLAGDTTEPAALSASGAASVVQPFQVPFSQLPAFTIVVSGDASGDDAGSGSESGSGSDSASGALPDTGGSNLLLIAGGAALVLGGAGVLAARRRAS